MSVETGGWGWPGLARKGHYFPPDELISLCRKWVFSGPRDLYQLASRDKCALCSLKLER